MLNFIEKLGRLEEAQKLMKRCFYLLALVAAAGCGVSHEVYNLRSKEVDRCKVEMNQAQVELRSAQTRADELATESNDLRDRLLALQMDRTQLAQNLQATQKDLATFLKAKKLAERQGELLTKLKAGLRPAIDAQKTNVEIRRGKLTVTIAENWLFEPGRAELRADARTLLEPLAAILRQERSREFLVSGHVDSNMLKGSPFRSNWDLTTAQSVSVVRALQAEGVDPRYLIAAGTSEFEPREMGEVVDPKRPVRRTEIVVLPLADELFPLHSP